jgi:valyl-tRNA synthetase
MSKSLKNGLEPGEAIEQFSSDSLRMAMMGGMIPGRNMRFGGNLADRLMENYRNFGNKVWNVARFLEGKLSPNPLSPREKVGVRAAIQGNSENGETLTPASLWILGKYIELEDKLDENTQSYELAHSVDALYDFLWNNFADWYVEYLKTEESQVPFAFELFKRFVITLSPYLPFECEVIWREFFGQDNLLAFAVQDRGWPKHLWSSQENASELSQEFERIVSFIQDLRSTRGLFAIDPGTSIQVYTKSKLLHEYSQFIKILARSELVDEVKPELYLVKKPQYEYSLDILSYVQDKEEEIRRTQKVMQDLGKQIQSLEGQLTNQKFLDNAEVEVIDDKRRNLESRKMELSEQQNKLQFLSK